jgi:hypothetical protein
MTRDQADEIAVFLSLAFGPWSEGKKAIFSDAIADLDHGLGLEAARLFVKQAKRGQAPLPGDIRELACSAAMRQGRLRLTDERDHGRPVTQGQGLQFLKEMRIRLERKMVEREPGALSSIGDLIGQEEEPSAT